MQYLLRVRLREMRWMVELVVIGLDKAYLSASGICYDPSACLESRSVLRLLSKSYHTSNIAYRAVRKAIHHTADRTFLSIVGRTPSRRAHLPYWLLALSSFRRRASRLGGTPCLLRSFPSRQYIYTRRFRASVVRPCVLSVLLRAITSVRQSIYRLESS
jgi:hypothetical protein